MEKQEDKRVLLVASKPHELLINELYIEKQIFTGLLKDPAPDNWDAAISYINENSKSIECIILSLSEEDLLIAQDRELVDKFEALVNRVKSFSHLILLKEKNRLNNFDIFDECFCFRLLFYKLYISDNKSYRKRINNLDSEDDIDTTVEEYMIENYFYDQILPAIFLANEEEWDELTSQDEILLSAIQIIQEKYGIRFTGSDIDRKYGMSNFYYCLGHIRERLHMPTSFRIKLYEVAELTRYDVVKSFLSSRVDVEDPTYEEDFFLSLFRKKDIESSVNSNDIWETHKWKMFKSYRLSKYKIQDKDIICAKKSIDELISCLYEKKMNISTYMTNYDQVSLLRAYLENKDDDVIYRRYVLKDQIFADEFESLLSLLQDYISTIRGVKISFEQKKTDIGTIYEIKCKKTQRVGDEFSNMVKDFGDFLQLCDHEEAAARKVLDTCGLSDKEKDILFEKYQKKARRLLTDLRQEYERKMMACRHALENEVGNSEENSTTTINIPSVDSNPATIIYADNYINMDNPRVRDIVLGDYTCNENDEQLLQYIKQLSDEYVSLYNELLILKDEQLDKNMRGTAFSKLMSFLNEHKSEIGSIAFNMLMKYLETCFN